MRPSSLRGGYLNRYRWLSLGAGILLTAIGWGIALSDLPSTVPANSGELSSTRQDSQASAEKVNIFAVPTLDTRKASVPLNDNVFDTFGRLRARYVPLNEADEELILELRDAINPINQPVYGPAEDLPWLDDYDLVMGYVSGNDAYAYPINILNIHECQGRIGKEDWKGRSLPGVGQNARLGLNRRFVGTGAGNDRT